MNEIGVETDGGVRGEYSKWRWGFYVRIHGWSKGLIISVGSLCLFVVGQKRRDGYDSTTEEPSRGDGVGRDEGEEVDAVLGDCR